MLPRLRGDSLSDQQQYEEFPLCLALWMISIVAEASCTPIDKNQEVDV